MKIIVPDPIHRLVQACPTEPALEDPTRLLKVAGSAALTGLCFEAAVPALRTVTLFHLVVAIALALALVGLMIWRLFGAEAKARNDKRQRDHQQHLETFARTFGPHLAKAVSALARQDYRGRYSPDTPVGKNEYRLEAALARSGLPVSREPSQQPTGIVAQYELTELGWRNRNYVADFAYRDAAANLRLDIEIDEAYHLSAAKQAKDRNRDATFVSRGWIVVRLPEAEVITKPDWCAEMIVKLAKALTHGDMRALAWIAQRATIAAAPPALPRS